VNSAFKNNPSFSRIFLLILITALLYAPSGVFALESDADPLFGFAESLFREGDYYRAISEYKRFIFLYPADQRSDTACFRIVESFFKARRWHEAIDSVRTYTEKFPAGRRIHDAYILKGISERNLKRYEESLRSFEHVIVSSVSGDVRERAFYEIALVHVEQENWDRARESLSNISVTSNLHPSAVRFSEGISRINYLSYKSPAAAGTFAALMPGAGHVYTERYRDALVAFLLNGAFILAAVELFCSGHDVAGGIVTFFEIGFYAGNIYSAVGSAHKYNRQERSEYIRKLKDDSLPISLRFDSERSAAHIMYSFRY